MRPILMRLDPHARLYFPSRCTGFLPRDTTVTLDGRTDTVRRGGLRLLVPTLLKCRTPDTRGFQSFSR